MMMMVEPNKHNQGLRLAEHNHKMREKLKAQMSESKLTSSQYYGIGVVIGYYVYQSKKGDMTPVHQSEVTSSCKFEMVLKWIRKPLLATCTMWQL